MEYFVAITMVYSYKKMWLGIGALLMLAVAASGQVQSSAYRLMLKKLLHHTVPEVQVQQVVADTAGILFVDAREDREFAVSHLAGALHVGYDSFDLKKIPPSIAKGRRIVVYCSVGYRSEKVAEKLRTAGFNNISNLYGGIFEWVNQGHPVRNAQGETQQVHAFDRSWGLWLHRGKKVYR